jgi:hypothetical protein
MKKFQSRSEVGQENPLVAAGFPRQQMIFQILDSTIHCNFLQLKKSHHSQRMILTAMNRKTLSTQASGDLLKPDSRQLILNLIQCMQHLMQTVKQ